MPFLHVESLYKTYDRAPLLTGVTFAVERGEIACLLGPSGSGKTTLLRILAGLETAESGRVWLADADLTAVPIHRREVGLMFQDYALFPHYTVAANVAFGLRMRGADRAAVAARVREMLALVGLTGFEQRDVLSLSGGERQRVALARSLAPQPRLLLLDEPLGALDRTLRERLLEELPAILRQVGVTAITVTHDQEEAFALADCVIVLHDGVVAQVGAPQAVYDAPADEWVARFLGLDALFAGRVVDGGVETAFGRLRLASSLPHAGADGWLLIHPWGVHLEPQPAVALQQAVAAQQAVASQLPNPFCAQVTRCTFHGPHYRVTLDLPGGALQVTRAAGLPAPPPGAQVCGWIAPEALRWIPALKNQ